MAKRAPSDERPYRPLLDEGVELLDREVVSSVLNNRVVAPAAPAVEKPNAARKLFEAPKPAFATREPVIESSTRPASPMPAPNRAMVEKFEQERRMLLTKAEGGALDRLVMSLASRLNTQVKLSHVLRALVSLALHAEGEIDRRAGETAGLVRPANGDVNAIQRFEADLARIIGAAIRDAGPMK